MSPFRATLLFGAVPAGSRVGGFSHSMSAATHITAVPLPPAIATVDEAIKVARWLGSVAAEMATHRQRKAKAEALASWLADYAEHVECVEHGCQMLLLQAAELVGKATPSRLKS